jgi:hypothetical protein
MMIKPGDPERGPRPWPDIWPWPYIRLWAGGSTPAGGARRWAFDAALAAAVIAAEVGGSHATTSWNQHHAAPGIVAYAVLVAGGASLLARRRYPVAVLAVTTASALVAVRLGADVVWFALIAAFPARSPGWRGFRGRLISLPHQRAAPLRNCSKAFYSAR